jgi:hypothetical protein
MAIGDPRIATITSIMCETFRSMPESGYDAGMIRIHTCVFLGASVLALACGGSGGGMAGDGGTLGGNGGSGSGLPSCDALCPGVLKAHCTGGPTSQADCVSGCQAVRNSKCLAQYQALYNCGGGSSPTYSCLSNGQVSLKGCDDKATALYSCLAMP